MRVIAIGAMLLLGACMGVDQVEIDRQTARATIAPLVEERFPGVPRAQALDCVIGNASEEQLAAMAANSSAQGTARNRQIVSDISGTSAALRCLAA